MIAHFAARHKGEKCVWSQWQLGATAVYGKENCPLHWDRATTARTLPTKAMLRQEEEKDVVQGTNRLNKMKYSIDTWIHCAGRIQDSTYYHL